MDIQQSADEGMHVRKLPMRRVPPPKIRGNRIMFPPARLKSLIIYGALDKVLRKLFSGE